MSEHRLGFVGNWGLKPHQVAAADRLDIGVKKVSFGEDCYVLENLPAGALPGTQSAKESLTLQELSATLDFLHQPIAGIAKDIAHDALGLSEQGSAEFRDFAENLGLGNTEVIITQAEILGDARRKEADNIRRDLHAVIRYMGTGSLKVEKLKHDNFDTYHDEHDDECEEVSRDMEVEAAWRHDTEIREGLLPSFSFDQASGKYQLGLHRHEYDTPARAKLNDIIAGALDMPEGADAPDFVLLNADELANFCGEVYNALYEEPDLIAAVESEEKFVETMASIRAHEQAFLTSPALDRLAGTKVMQASQTPERMAALDGAAKSIRNMLEHPDFQKIWRKYNVTGGKNIKAIAEITDRLDQMGAAIAEITKDGHQPDYIELEAVTAEFRDVIATSRHMLGHLKKGLSGKNADVLNSLNMLDLAFENASLSPVAIAADHLDHDMFNAAHYVGRHIGTEGINFTRSFKEFVDDFGGEVVEFIQKNPLLTAVSVVGLYSMMQSTAAQPVSPEMQSLLGDASSAPGYFNLDMMMVENENVEQAIIKMCHYHVPKWLPFGEHCLVSNQAAIQLGDAYALMKAPLSMILAAPENGTDLITQMRGAEAPAFAFVDSFNASLKNFGDAYFVANGYQNLAHAPWFGIAAAMGWKLGMVESMKRTSMLITPLADAGYTLLREKPMIAASALMAGAYGYTQQGLSGAVSGLVLGGVAGGALHGVESLVRMVPKAAPSHAPQWALNLTTDAVSATRAEHLSGTLSYVPPQEPLHIQDAYAEQTFANKLNVALDELRFVLETQSGSLGIDADDEKGGDFFYRNHVLEALDYIQVRLDEGTPVNNETGRAKLDVVMAAQRRHMGADNIFEIINDRLPTKQESYRLGIEGARLQQYFGRRESHKADYRAVGDLAANTVKSLSRENFTARPLRTALAVPFRLVAAVKHGVLKPALRESWYLATGALAGVQKSFSRISPVAKGNMIGASAMVAAAAIGADASPELGQALATQLGDQAHDISQGISSATGHAAGASTATGLFAIYNFGEDHMVVHVSLGFAFITASSAIKNAIYKPLQFGLLKPAKVLVQGFEDVSGIGLSRSAKASGKLLAGVRSAIHDASHYDRLYLERH